MMTEQTREVTIFSVPVCSVALAPLMGERVRAGFPSPAENYIEDQLDLNQYCVKNPPATFFVRVEGDSMTGTGIDRGDLLVVDRSLTAGSEDVIVAIVDGEFTLKRLVLRDGRVFLRPENPRHRTIEITEDMEFQVWGRVTKVVHEL